MNVRQSLLGQAVLLVGTAAYSVMVAPSLGSVVPTHWGISGKPDAWGSPTFSLWFGPGMMAIMLLLTLGMPKISPKKFEIDRFEDTYGTLMFVVGMMMAAMHVVILMATAGKATDITKMIMIVLGVFFAIMGNFMGKVKRNFYMGVRTPWTLASERVWDATHRRAASLWFFGGLLIAFCAMVGLPAVVNIVILLAIALWPVADSYFLYRRTGEGESGTTL